MTLSVEVETGKRERALVLPVAALRAPGLPVAALPAPVLPAPAEGSASTSAGSLPNPSTTISTGTVWLARDGRVEARSVRLGLRTLEAVEVTDGLAAGDHVLIGAAPAPGARVRVALVASTVGAAADGAGAKRTQADPTSSISNAMGR